MSNKKPNKGEVFAMFLIFIILNGIALYFISKFFNMGYFVLVVTFISIFVIIDVIKRIRNYIILKKEEEKQRKQAEIIRQKQEELEREKEERKQIAIAKQRARNEAMNKSQKKKKRR